MRRGHERGGGVMCKGVFEGVCVCGGGGGKRLKAYLRVCGSKCVKGVFHAEWAQKGV